MFFFSYLNYFEDFALSYLLSLSLLVYHPFLSFVILSNPWPSFLFIYRTAFPYITPFYPWLSFLILPYPLAPFLAACHHIFSSIVVSHSLSPFRPVFIILLHPLSSFLSFVTISRPSYFFRFLYHHFFSFARYHRFLVWLSFLPLNQPFASFLILPLSYPLSSLFSPLL